jgi:hypothetical protein
LKVEDIEEQVRAAQLQQRWRKLDLLLASIGTEIADLFVIALALAILCAPIAFGIGATWAAAYFAGAASGMVWLGWVAGAAVFVFFCRYIWGSRLQRASRRAVAALIAGK